MIGKPNRRQNMNLYRQVIVQQYKKLRTNKPDLTATLPGQAFNIF